MDCSRDLGIDDVGDESSESIEVGEAEFAGGEASCMKGVCLEEVRAISVRSCRRAASKAA